ncbi:MAG: hypothetical protein OXE84_14110, partial [Rhodobacteraceae bacterium]|nr:hypothetical protein [Paracoccaceae bacterium]
EAANTMSVSTRLKRSGQRWSHAGGQGVPTFRARLKSGRFDNVWTQLTHRRRHASTCPAAAFDLLITFDGLKDSKAVGKLIQDKDKLFALTDCPAEHWTQIRTPNPVESVFRAVRNRTRKTACVMVDTLMMSAKSKWRR